MFWTRVSDAATLLVVVEDQTLGCLNSNLTNQHISLFVALSLIEVSFCCMRPLPIPEDELVPHGIMARAQQAILLMCGYILIGGVLMPIRSWKGHIYSFTCKLARYCLLFCPLVSGSK